MYDRSVTLSMTLSDLERRGAIGLISPANLPAYAMTDSELRSEQNIFYSAW